MKTATNLMKKLAAQLFPSNEVEQEAFLGALLQPSGDKNQCVLWTGDHSDELILAPKTTMPAWVPDFVDSMGDGPPVGKSQAYADGRVYPMDFSSILTASAMLQIPASAVERVLDVCAAPGGKSFFAKMALQPDLLLSNEVIGKRLGILRHNLKKSGLDGCYTHSMEVHELVPDCQRAFDAVLVDAPCSGQSLLAKGIDNPGCFHPNIVKGNAKRQLKILTAASEAVASGGWLFYSSCTFATRENEWVMEKFLANHLEFRAVVVDHLTPMRSALSEHPCYRIYPHRDGGAGGFVALLQRDDSAGRGDVSARLLEYPVK
ncbi:MAG: RsmB/NOP family class I SAM-dependent RNA methyltransferase [Verrucomicrobiota bacterium]